MGTLFSLGDFPSLAREGWRQAPEWFEMVIPTNQIGMLYQGVKWSSRTITGTNSAVNNAFKPIANPEKAPAKVLI